MPLDFSFDNFIAESWLTSTAKVSTVGLAWAAGFSGVYSTCSTFPTFCVLQKLLHTVRPFLALPGCVGNVFLSKFKMETLRFETPCKKSELYLYFL